jgi:hypothetical protein
MSFQSVFIALVISFALVPGALLVQRKNHGGGPVIGSDEQGNREPSRVYTETPPSPIPS